MNGIQPGAKPLGQFHSVVVGPEMDEERARLVVEHVIVNRGDLDAVVLQGLDQGIDRAGLGCLNSFPRMISGVPPGLVVRNRRWSVRRRKGVARPELQPTIGGGKFQAATANGDGWK